MQVTISQPLGQHLLQKQLINKEKLRACLAEQSITQERLGLILVRNGFVTRSDLLSAILATNPAQIHGEQVFSARVPANILIETQSMIIAETQTQVFIATLQSERQTALAIKPFYPDLELVFTATNYEKLEDYLADLERMSSSQNSVSDRIIRQAFSELASDIHVIPRHLSYSIFFRKYGKRILMHEGPLDEYNNLAANIKDKARMDLAERRIPQDGGFSMEYNGKLVDLRVATLPAVNGEVIVIRLLDPDRVQPSLDRLGITKVSEWRKGVSRSNGLCLICGPTGSGKTTTLNASLKEMDRFSNAIYTLEDPVEYRLPYTGQVNINNSIGLDFARGLRAFMRADPDIIIVGEIRDAETARNAIKAGETGHLVIGTMHVNNIMGTVNRLRDLDIPPNELVYLLRAVLVQNLIRTLCTHCHGKGCTVCNDTGYNGRTIISECAYFAGEDDVKSLLKGERWWDDMIDDAILKAEQGITSYSAICSFFGQPAVDRLTEMQANGKLDKSIHIPTTHSAH